jgi:hypothetical protein
VGTKRRPAGGKARREQRPPQATKSGGLSVRKLPGEQGWEIVHPRCARERQDDLEEVEKMIAAGEHEIAVEELRWLLDGCHDCLAAHRLLGELALAEHDLPLARGHFGYAYRLVTQAMQQAKAKGPLPYSAAANQGFFEAAKGLVWCLKELGKVAMARDVVAQLLAFDPADPLAVKAVLEKDGSCQGGEA